MVPPPAHLHLAAVQPDGAALADRRRHRGADPRPRSRNSRMHAPQRLGPRRPRRRQADLRHVGDRRSRCSSIRGGSCSPATSRSRWRRASSRRRRSSSRTASRRPTSRRPTSCAASGKPWAVHEVETTVDFCPRNPVLTWVLGGLNYQIEHHLFPRVPHTHYPRIAQIVRRNAAKHGVRYTAQPSLCAALRSHQRHLRDARPAGPAGRDRDGLGLRQPLRSIGPCRTTVRCRLSNVNSGR